MVGVGDVGLYTASLFALTAFVASVIRYELEMGAFVSALTAVSVTSAGVMVSLALQVGLDVPFVRSFGLLASVALLFVVLYELLSRQSKSG